jgi:hypothetical protein
MGRTKSRLDDREPKWWTALTDWCEQNGIPTDGDSYDALFDLILRAIEEDGATELGSRGGQKGGKARAANMTPQERSAAASAAARKRWGSKWT